MYTRNTLIEIYLDWFNNYLTIEHYAKCNGLTVEQATILINLARSVANSDHPEV